MLAGPVDWKGKAGRAMLALLLSVFSGVLTAAYAAYRLSTAWTAITECNPPPANSTCPSYAPFWGFAPPEFLAACLVGIAIGLLIAVVGWELHRRAFGMGRGSAALLVLSLAGLVAYGGFGVGAAAGVAASYLYASFRPKRTPPAEWSGTLPHGVPAVKNPPRPLAERPSLTEWSGPSLPASRTAAPPGPTPQEDRLAEALARLRGFGNAPPRDAGTASPADALPRVPTVANPPPERKPATSVTSVARNEARTVAPAHRPLDSHSADARGRAGSSAAAQTEGTRPRSNTPTEPRPEPRPDPTISREVRTPPSGQTEERSPAPQRPALPNPAPSAPVPFDPGAGVSNRAGRLGRDEPGVSKAQGRVRAWTCPNCRLVNAPWSSVCTRCKTPAAP